MERKEEDEGWVIEVSREKYISHHGVFEYDENEGHMKATIGYDEVGNILEYFDLIVKELAENYQKELWYCKKCGNRKWYDKKDEHSPNCTSCGHPYTKKK